MTQGEIDKAISRKIGLHSDKPDFDPNPICETMKRHCNNRIFSCKGFNMVVVHDTKQHECKWCGNTGLNITNTAGDVHPMQPISKLDGYVDKTHRKPPFMGTIYGKFITTHHECNQCHGIGFESEEE